MAAIERDKKLAAALTACYNDYARDVKLTQVDPEVVAILAAPLARLAKMVIPDVHAKIDEVIVAADYPGLAVNANTHGYDLVDAHGNHIEVKTSVCKERAPKCNFNWPVPKGTNDAERYAKLRASIQEKVAGGFAWLFIRDGMHRQLYRYELSEAFLLEYFARVPLGISTVHNMGCQRCKSCKHFHRLDRMQHLATKMANAKVAVTDAEWNELFERIDAHCTIAN